MKQDAKNYGREILQTALGAVALAADAVTEGARCVSRTAKRVWNEHESERQALAKKLIECKGVCKRKCAELLKLDADFDDVVRALERLSPEELSALREILRQDESETAPKQ